MCSINSRGCLLYKKTYSRSLLYTPEILSLLYKKDLEVFYKKKNVTIFPQKKNYFSFSVPKTFLGLLYQTEHPKMFHKRTFGTHVSKDLQFFINLDVFYTRKSFSA